MKQKQYAPQNIAQMGLMIYCANEGHLNDVEVAKIGDFEDALLSFMAAEYADTMKTIVETGDWNKDFEAKFKEGIEKFKATQTY